MTEVVPPKGDLDRLSPCCPGFADAYVAHASRMLRDVGAGTFVPAEEEEPIRLTFEDLLPLVTRERRSRKGFWHR